MAWNTSGLLCEEPDKAPDCVGEQQEPRRHVIGVAVPHDKWAELHVCSELLHHR